VFVFVFLCYMKAKVDERIFSETAEGEEERLR
jgi:hypothetical protein